MKERESGLGGGMRTGRRLIPVPGGEVMVTRARGRAFRRRFEAHTVPTFDVRGRTVLFFSDLHLFSKRGAPSAAKLDGLLEFIESVPNPFVVFGGDIFEMRGTEWDRIRGALDRGRDSGVVSRSESAFAGLCDALRGVDSVLLPGNHDPWEWYADSRVEGELYSERAPRIRLITENGVVLAVHGHEVFMDHDEATWGGIEKVPRPFVRLFFYYEAVGFTLFGTPFLRWMYRHINRAFRAAAADLRVAFDADAVIFGHSHLPENDPEVGLHVCGFSQHGQLNAVVVGPTGDVGRRTVWYHPVARAAHRLRRALLLESS